MKFAIFVTLFVASQASLEEYGLKATDLCCYWASLGQCDANAFWMRPNCGTECGTENCDVSDAQNCQVNIRSDCLEWNEQSEGYSLWVQKYNEVHGSSQNMVQELQPSGTAENLPLVDTVEPLVDPVPSGPLVDSYGSIATEESSMVEEQLQIVEEPFVQDSTEATVDPVVQVDPILEIVEPSGYDMEAVEAPAPMEPAPVQQVVEAPAPIEPTPVVEVVEAPAPLEPAPVEEVVEVPEPVEPAPVEEVVEVAEPFLPVELPAVEQGGYGSVEPSSMKQEQNFGRNSFNGEDETNNVDHSSLNGGLNTNNSDLVNKHPLCNFWATMGECEANNSYMMDNCAQACQN